MVLGKSVRKLGWGLVDWETTLASLQAMNFDGPISMHSEYQDVPPETVVDLTRTDVQYINDLAKKIV